MTINDTPPAITEIVALSAIDISALNTRKNLTAGTEDAGIEDLARSIAAQGLLSPPLLRRAGDRFELIAGQRRVLACRQLGWVKIEGRIVDLADSAALAASLTENVQRADMHPMDKARALDELEQALGSRHEVAKRTGLSTRTIQRYLRLLALPERLQGVVGTGSGPVGVGFLSSLAQRYTDPDAMEEVFDKVSGFDGKLAEEIVRRSNGDRDRVNELVDLAAAGRLGLHRCGSSLDTCPYLPDHLRAEVRILLGDPETQ